MHSPGLLIVYYCLFKFVVVCPAEGGHDVLVLDEHKGRHGHYVVLNRDIFAFIYVHLQQQKLPQLINFKYKFLC